MMRLLVLDQAVGVWGAQQYLLRLAPLLARRGVEMTLGAPEDLDISRAWRAAQLPYVPIAMQVVRSVRQDGDGSRLGVRPMATEAATTVRTARAIARAARRGGFDAVHANGHGVHLEAALGGRLARVPTVLHLHEEMPQRFGTAVRNAAVAVAPRSVAVSDAVRGSVHPRLRGRVEVIRNGVDLARIVPTEPDPAVRAELGAADGEVLFTALTRLDPVKRIEDLVRAAASLAARPGWHLAVVGVTSSFPDYSDEVQRLAKDLAGDRITFAGHRRDIDRVLGATDVLVHAGVVEGLPLGLVEAKAAGRPVVAYSVAGVPEVIEHERTGLLVAPLDVDGLATAMRRLADDATERDRMGRAARLSAVAHDDIESQADHYADVLAHLAPRPREV